MTAKDAISPYRYNAEEPFSGLPMPRIMADVPLVDVLPRLLEAPAGRLRVVEEGVGEIGEIDTRSMLEALGRMIAPRDDSSVITVECHAADYSASLLARAVEDADAHLTDLWSAPAASADAADMVRVTLRVRLENPEAAVRSLRRYGFDVVDAAAHGLHDATADHDRLSALQAYLNV